MGRLSLFHRRQLVPGIPKTKTKRPVKGFIIALLLSVAAGFAVYYTIQYYIRPAPVLVATHDIKALSKIGPEDVELTTVGVAYRHPRAASYPEQVVGTYAASPIYQGTQIISPMVIRNPGQMIKAAGDLKRDETLLSLSANKVSWPAVIRDGDYVSVVAVYADRVEDVVRGVRVASEATAIPVISDIAGVRDPGGDKSSSKITLVLRRDDAMKVLLAMSSSKGVYLLPESADYVLGGSAN